MRLNYEAYGSGEPLVILHGLFGSLENWRTVARELARHFRVYSLDLRNHGRSPHGDDFDYRVMADDVRAFVAEESLQPVVLLGHSLGGKVAMQVAVTWPDMVQKLVVVDMAPREYRAVHREILDALLSLHPERFSSRREVDEALAASIPDTTTRLFLLKNLVTAEGGRFTWRINLDAIDRHYAELLKGLPQGSVFNGPTAFVKGERSDYIRPEDIPHISGIFPQARLVTVPNAGHWVHAENPEFFLTAVISFLHGA